MKRVSAILATAFLFCGAFAEEEIYREDFDHFGEYTEGFNDGAGVTEARNGVLCLAFAPKAASDFRQGCFRIDRSPKGKDWRFAFQFRFHRDLPREFTLKFLFGDRGNPDVRTLTVAERGSHFGCESVPSPKDGMQGFLQGRDYRDWNKGAVVVSNGRAAFWTYRGGKLTKDCETAFPPKPLVGWNLAIQAEEGGEVDLDQVVLTDGTARPYDRGDLTEALAKPAVRPTWDAAFGREITPREPLKVDFAHEACELRVRYPKGVERTAVIYNSATGEVARIEFFPSDEIVQIQTRECGGGVFTNVTRRVSLKAEKVSMWGAGVLAHESFRMHPTVAGRGRYTGREIAELHANRGNFLHLTNAVYAIRTVGIAPNRFRVFLNDNVLSEFETSVPVVSVGRKYGCEMRGRTAPVSDPDPQAYRLPVAPGGFALDRVRENLGTYALECNGFLQRSAFDAMPSSCLFQVPRRQWARAKAVCRVDPSAPASAVPVITARLTHHWWNGGRSLAMCEKTVDLRTDTASFVKKGELYEVTFDFDIGSLQDLVHMKDGLVGRTLPYLHFEFLGPLWEKNRFYMDPGRMPAESSVSSLVVLSGELEASPADLTAVANRPFSLYYPDEEPGATVTVVPRVPGAYAVEATVSDETGRVVERQAFTAKETVSRRLVFGQAKEIGWYGVVYALKDAAGRTLVTHEASFARLRPNTRQAGLDSPYYAWNFFGALGTPPDIDDWGEKFRRLGIVKLTPTFIAQKRPKTKEGYREDSPELRKYGVTVGEFPYTWQAGKSADERLKAMKEMVEAYPHSRAALIFHESGWAEFPHELYGGVTPQDDATRATDSNKVAKARSVAEDWRKADPTLKLIHGNSGETVGVLAQLMRGGYPKELMDAMGEESIGMSEPPEISTALLPWQMKRLARHYGYPERIDCPWEWKARFFPYRYEKDKTQSAGVVMRDALISLALGYSLVHLHAGTETGNSYADTIWCHGAFARWPLAYPRPEAAAAAFLTQILDCARFVRQVPTGSLTVYALEFETREGRVYALWDARGETSVAVDWSPFLGLLPKTGACEVFSHSGRPVALRADGRIAVGEEPVYLVTDDRVESFAADPKRAFPRERPAGMDRAKVLQPLASADEINLVLGPDRRLDKADPAIPRRPGTFAVESVEDDEKGPCVELTHLSQTSCHALMTEYCVLRFRNPQTVALDPRPTALGVWVKGNSNWGKVFLEFRDAEGETWFSCGCGGIGCRTYDWPHKMATNYDGWNFLQLPLVHGSPVKNASPGDNEFQWVRDGRGNGRIDFPITVTAVAVGQYGRTLDLLEMKSGSPKVRIGSVEAW